MPSISATSWDFATTTARTLRWYRRVIEAGEAPLACCLDDLTAYVATSPPGRATPWSLVRPRRIRREKV